MKNILLLFTALVYMTTLSSWDWNTRKNIKGSKHVVREVRESRSFDKIRSSRSIRVIVSEGNSHSLEVEADDNILPYIKTEIKNNTLSVYLPNDIQVRSYKAMNVYVSTPALSALHATTSSQIESDSYWNVEDLSIRATTSAVVQLNVTAQKINVDITTSAQVILSGKTDNLETRMTTSSSLQAEKLIAENVKISGTTSSSASVFATNQLKYALTTSAVVAYSGEAYVTAKASSGGYGYKKKN